MRMVSDITDGMKALDAGGDAFTIYDARAAVYQKMGKLKDALRDSKTTIDIQPHRWQVSVVQSITDVSLTRL